MRERMALRAWFWVEAEAFPSTAKELGRPGFGSVYIGGWRLPWKRIMRRIQST
jgi:hypothetical protein